MFSQKNIPNGTDNGTDGRTDGRTAAPPYGSYGRSGLKVGYRGYSKSATCPLVAVDVGDVFPVESVHAV